MKIVIATDFSPHAAAAADAAVALARRLGDTLVLAHALSFPLDLELGRGDIGAALRDQARGALADAAASLRKSGIPVEERLLVGSAPHTIADLGREMNARLIVLGAHGRSAGARLFLGSVAERTALLADRPVMIIRDERLGWNTRLQREDRPLRVVLGIDRSGASLRAAAWVRELSAATATELTVLHAYWPVAELTRVGLDPRVASDGDPRVVEKLLADLGPIATAATGGAGTPIRLVPTQASFAACIAAEAQALDADLVIIGTHQRRGLQWLRLGSTVHPLLRAAHVPIICVPVTT
jgi:nucleotide-binding universal stress UspA family protein